MCTRIVLGLFLTIVFANVCAQDGFVAQSQTRSYEVFDKDGKSFVNPAPDVAGSPFLKADWVLGTIILIDNRKYDSVKLKLNLVSQEVHFLNKENKELALGRGYIKEVFWHVPLSGLPNGVHFRCGFPATDAQDLTSFYEVLSEGKLSLLRSVRKVISQRKDELSGEVTREYVTYDDYYAFDGKIMQRVKKDRSFVESLLADKKDPVNQFAVTNNLKFKSFSDIKRMIDFYNTLP